MVVKKTIHIVIYILLSFGCVFGQETDSEKDTVLLDEVEIRGISLQKFTSGNKVETIDEVSELQFQSSSLSDLLQQRTPLYLKTYGSSMLATPSFRGTSASHTAVVWNGININSSSLGQSDFSIIPVFSIDKVSVHYGGGSTLFGSDAIGGTIDLTSSPNFGEGWNMEVQQDIGSFNHYYTSFSVKHGGEKLSFRTGIFHRSFKNDFPFINTTRFNSPKERQQNAAVQQWGFVQDINVRTGTRNYLTFNSWFNMSDREVQPTMTNRQGDDQQKDQNFRSVVNYHHYSSLGHSNVRAGYIYDLIDFNGSVSVIDRINSAIQHDFDLTNSVNIRVGADWNHIMANVPGHGRAIVEDRNDLYFLSRFTPGSRTRISINVRKPFVSGFSTPLAPSLGTEFVLIEKAAQKLTWKGNISKNYRVPTLNDRFWSPGGNVDILPELSLNTEMGLLLESELQNFTNKTEISIYRNLVDEWIIWMPLESYWSPKNLKKVKATGLEVSHKSDFHIEQVKVQSGLAYLFSKTTSLESDLQEEVGKQLPYTPMHSGTWYARIIYKSWMLNPVVNYTGTRYTTSSQDRKLEDYTLLDLWLGKDLKWGAHSLHTSFRINNLTNKIYQNYEYRAMPGRHVNLSLTLSLN